MRHQCSSLDFALDMGMAHGNGMVFTPSFSDLVAWGSLEGLLDTDCWTLSQRFSISGALDLHF